MWRFLVRLFAVVGVIAVLIVAGLGVAAWRITATFDAPDPVAEDSVLVLDLGRAPSFTPDGGVPLPFAGPDAPTVAEVADAIVRAAADPRITGLVATADGAPLSFAVAQELRGAVDTWRDSGKPAWLFADDLGTPGAGNAVTYLASAFDEIWLRHEGQVALTGVRIEVPFARDALDALSVEPQFARQGDYKTFPETFTESGFTPAHREMVTSLAGDLFAQLVDGIADGRGLSPAVVRGLIDDAPLLAEEAESAGLIDAIGDDTAFDAALEERLGEVERLSPSDYLARTAEERPAADTRIALIHITGSIVAGGDEEPPGFGGNTARGGEIAAAIDEAAETSGIAGILLRIDSPGGSAIATARIASAVQRARDAGLPVIASMGPVAASGGYWVASGADEIVAQPATLTGSIGVFAGKFSTRRLWQDLGVRWGIVQEGDNAGLFSLVTPFTAGEQARIAAVVDALYAQFIAVVAAGRGLEPAAVEAVASGRVWTGAQAAGIGLVDALGGRAEALARLRAALDLPADAPLALERFPEPPGLWETVQSLGDGGLPAVARLGMGTPPLDAALAVLADDPAGHTIARFLTILADGQPASLVMPPMVVR